MRDTTATLAQSITWAGSKQTYYTGRLMVDKNLVGDFYRAYAYFRWADDKVDLSASNDDIAQSNDDHISFIRRQRELIDHLYSNRRPDNLTPEEEILAILISHDQEKNSGLRSFIFHMFSIIEFDAYRKGRLISQTELIWYSTCLGKSVTDGLQYFIGHGHPYPVSDDRYLVAMATHITHLLRDMVQDIADGFINIPSEYLAAQGIGPEDVNSPPFRAWVRSRVLLARAYFRDGKRYLDNLEVLRCKIAGYWYCTRFEGVLDTIERDGYRLRAEYRERYKPSTWLKIVWLSVAVTIRHVARRGLLKCWRN